METSGIYWRGARPGAAPLVLIVDDFADGREMYAEFLRGAGYRVVEAADGRQGVALARDLSPAVVLMDLSLPVLDGISAMRALRDDARTASIPVIALTAHGLEEDVRAARQAGCSDVLVKPCSPDSLVRAIERMLAETELQSPS